MEHENNGQWGWHADAAPPPSIYWKLEVGLIKAVCCRCRHGSKTPALQLSPPRACNLIRRGRREIPACISITPKLDRTDPATLNFGLRTVSSTIKVTSIDAMDREPQHTHTHSKRVVWRWPTHTYSDSNFQKRIRRLIGSTAGEWEIDECFGSGDQ